MGKLKYEGEYLNGEKNGKWKEYNDDGKLIFEGEYLNGERNGNGKEYNDDGKLIFEGEYLNNKRRDKNINNEKVNNKYNEIIKYLSEPFYLDEFKLDKLKKSNKDKCFICLANFKEKMQCLYLPCRHLFHSICIMDWLLEHKKCPECNLAYRSQPINNSFNFTSNNQKNYDFEYDLNQSRLPQNGRYNYIIRRGNWRDRGYLGRRNLRGRGNWRVRGSWGSRRINERGARRLNTRGNRYNNRNRYQNGGRGRRIYQRGNKRDLMNNYSNCCGYFGESE